MENETDSTPASTSATPAPSKYRSRFHIKPNLNAKRPAAPTETHAATTAAESHVSAQIHEPAVEIEKIVTDVEEPPQLSENITETPATPTNSETITEHILQSTPVLTSLLSSPSKYRSRFQAKPNLNLSATNERKLNNFVDEADSTGFGTNPVVAATSIVSQKINDPPTRINKRRFESTRELDRSLFTMADLIYWNPDNGSGLKKDTDEDLPESRPEAEKPKETNSVKEDLFAPQVRVNADGSIVIDETSLTVKKTKEDIGNLELVRESNKCKNSRLTSFSFRRNPISRPKTWNEGDTDKFYRILKMVGTDFSMMAEYFPKRKRNELKNKFRKECKENPSRIDAAMMRSSSPLQIPKRLLKLRKVSDENEIEADSGDDDVQSVSDIQSVNSAYADDDESEEEDEDEQMHKMFKRPTRSGRLPKPVRLPQMSSVESLPKWKKEKRQKFAAKVVETLKTPKQADTSSKIITNLTAPGPSQFPKYIPSSVNSTPVSFENGETSRIITTDSPGQQILLVHEKSKEVGKPDLVHIYLVSSPAVGTAASPSLAVNRRTPTSQQFDPGLELNAADLINRNAEEEISLTIAAENEIAINIESENNSDVILVDI